eukprot:TRINITY_DN2974_c1_g1_i1.p1 TRINITY_DN2974_c1_g1~~TRINITY_DN2974_c1_g1_i1.p1  ORF type:complete len:2256 (+),score=483.29 TRINITY_DN2974_c1_g1_i1:35-6769(+)
MAFGRKQALAPKVCTTPYNPNTRTWWEVQEKVFTRWMNTHLRQRELELEMGGLLRGGLDDGKNLWELLAEISNKEEEMPRYNRRPKMRIHKINNLLVSLQFIEKEKIRLVNIAAEDLLDRQVKLILGLIWTLILRYQIQKGNKDAHGSAKNELLKWLHSIGIDVKDLTHDWADGKQICKLVNKIQELIPESDITDDPLDNAQLAIDTAFDEFEIPRVIDASDMASDEPDELVNMTYLSYFRDKWDELKAMAGGELLGENPRTVKAKKPVTFSLSTYNVVSGNQMNVQVKDKLTGKPVPVASHTPFKFNSAKKDNWDVTFTPLVEGNVSVEMQINGKPVKAAPLVLFVTPASFAKVLDGPRTATATKPFTFKLQTSNIAPKDLDIEVKSDKGTVLPHKIVDTGVGGIYEVVFTSPVEGTATAVVKLEGEVIPGSPVTFKVDPKPFAKLRKPEDKPTASKPVKLVFDVINVSPDDISVTVKNPKGTPIALPRLKDNKNGTFGLEFVPTDEGSFNVEAKMEGKHVEGSPLTLTIDPAPWAKLHPPATAPTASKPVQMKLECVNVKSPDLKVVVKDDKGKVLYKPSIKPDGPDFKIEFTPTGPGSHVIEVELEGKPVEGSPLKFTIDPKPWAKLQKPTTKPVVSKPFKLVLDVVNVKPSDLEGSVTGPDGEVHKPLVTDMGNGKFEIEFTPTAKGKTVIDLKLDGKPVEGCPMELDTEPKPWAKLHRPSQVPTASKKFVMKMDVINVKPSDLEAVVTNADGKPLSTPTIKDNSDGTFDLVFLPTDEGKLVVDVKLDGQHVEGSPMILTSDPKPWAKLRKPESNPVAKKPFKMILDSVNVKPTDLEGRVTDSDGNVLKPEVKDMGNGVFELEFTPDDKGDIVVTVELEGKPVDGCPMTLSVEPEPWAKLTKPDEGPVADHPYKMRMETVNVKPEALELRVLDSEGKQLMRPQLSDLGDGLFEIEFTPSAQGDCVVHVDLDGSPVDGCPMSLSVDPCPWARVVGSNEKEASATRPFEFKIETVNVKPEDLNIAIKDKKGKDALRPKYIKVEDNGDDTFTVKFTPKKRGKFVVTVDLEDKPIENSPINLNVLHAPTATLSSARKKAVASKPYNFSLDIVNVLPEDLDISINDEDGNALPLRVTMNDDGTFDVNFIPMDPGTLNAKVKLHGSDIEGAPFEITVDPLPTATYSGPRPVQATATKPCTVKLSTVNLKPEELEVNLVDKEGEPVPVEIISVNPDEMHLNFTPMDPGSLVMELMVDGLPIDGTPIPIEVAPAPYVRLIKPKDPPYANTPYNLILESVNVVPDDLEIDLVTDLGDKLPFKVIDNGDGTFGVSFTPNDVGGMTANLKLDGEDVDGAPLRLDVTNPPSARLIGPNPAKATARRPFTFQIEKINVDPEDLVISVTDDLGKRLPYRVKDVGKNVIEVKIKPREKGALQADVLLHGEPVEGAPLSIKVLPEPWAKLVGQQNRHLKLGGNVPLVIEKVNVEPTDLQLVVTDASGNRVKGMKIQNNPDDDNFTVDFNPPAVGKYTVDVIYNDNQESIENCPCVIHADSKTNWSDALKDLLNDMDEAQYYDLVAVSDLDYLSVNSPVTFHIVPNTTEKKLMSTAVSFTGIVSPEGGGQVPALITSIGGGKFQLRFVPITREKHTVDVQLKQKSIRNSPQDVFIGIQNDMPKKDDSNLRIGVAVDKNDGTVGVPMKFQISHKSAEVPLISHVVRDPKENELQTEQAITGDDSLSVSLTPSMKGPHAIRVFYEGAPTSGEPVIFNVNPSPAARLIGGGDRTGHATVAFTFQIATVNVKRKHLTCGVKGPDGKVCNSLNLDPTGKDTMKAKFTASPGRPKNYNGVSDGVFDLTFTPKNIGVYTVMFYMNKKPIPGSPMQVTVGSSPLAISASGATEEVLQSPTNVGPQVVAAAPVRTAPIQATPIQATTVKTTTAATPTPVSAPVEQNRLLGPSQREGKAGRTHELVVSGPVSADELSVKVMDTEGKSHRAKKKDADDGTVSATYRPSAPGTYRVDLTVHGDHIIGSPATLTVGGTESKKKASSRKKPKTSSKKPKSSSSRAKQEQTIETVSRTVTRVTVGRSFTIKLSVAGSGGVAAEAPIADSEGNQIDIAKCEPAGNDAYNITWVPTQAGKFSTQLVIGGKPVDGSQFEFESHAVPITCKPVKNSDEIGPGIPCFITFAIENAKPKRLKAVIRGDDGKLGTDVTTKKNSDGTFDVHFTPPNSNSFTVELVADRVAVENKLTIQLV